MSRAQVGAIAGSSRGTGWIYSNNSGSYQEPMLVFEPQGNFENIILYYSFSRVLTKMTKDGVVIWQKTLNIFTDRISVMARISDGSIFLAGIYDDLFDRALLVKLDSSGNILWSHSYTAGYEVLGFGGFATSPDGSHMYIAFSRKINNGDPNTAVRPANLLKISSANGSVIWSREIQGAAGLRANPWSLATNAAGDVHVVGNDMINSNFDFRAFLIKYNSSGTLQWQRQISRNDAGSLTQACFLYGVRLDSSNNVYVSGAYRYAGSPTFGDVPYYAKFNSSGTLQHQYGILPNPVPVGNFPVYMSAYSIHGGSDSTSYVTGFGYLNSSINTHYSAYIFKINDGVLDYSKMLFSTIGANNYGEARAMILDSSHMYFSTSIFAGGGQAGFFKLPINGSKTGKYQFLSATTTYTDVSAQLVAPPVTVTTGSMSSSALSETLFDEREEYGAVTTVQFQNYLRRF